MNRFLILPAAALAISAILLGACGGDDDNTTTRSGATVAASATKSASKGAPVLKNPTTTASGLKYEDEVVGTGASPETGRRVTVHYTGTLVNGTKFDSSLDRGQPFTFVIGVGQVIKGWDEGVMTMKVGGKRLLYIPANLGYGSRSPSPAIPANSDLIFEVELLGVQ
ncbi:MAG: FKBP-type peptidyl-prolyl cis-trans isomerase [Dehalococcoidia bacterium]|nr:FKBP-type peptidyl-prolyl cis-trans isomerase [Dehalococcoidia bacterium]